MAERARTDIELMRIVASLAVVAIHAGGVPDGPALPRDTVLKTTALILNSASRFSVPLFFAISGWTFLVASPVTSPRALAQRITRVLVPLLSWTVIYGVLANKHQLSFAVVPKVAWMFVTGTNIYHFWFLYAYVPLFLTMGLVTLLLRGGTASRGVLVAAFAIMMLAASTSIFALSAAIRGTQPTASGWYAPPYAIGDAIVGALLLTRSRRDTRLAIAGAFLYVVAVAATVVWSRYFGFDAPAQYGSIVTSAATVGVVLALTGWSLGPRATRVVTTIARASFGLYLVHLLVLDVVIRITNEIPALHGGTWWAGVTLGPLHVAATFAISLGLSLAWGRAPRLRRLLG